MNEFDILHKIVSLTIGYDLTSVTPDKHGEVLIAEEKYKDNNPLPLPLTDEEVDKIVRWTINNGSKQTYDELYEWFKPIVKYPLKDDFYEVRFQRWFGGIYKVNKDFSEIKLIGRQ